MELSEFLYAISAVKICGGKRMVTKKMFCSSVEAHKILAKTATIEGLSMEEMEKLSWYVGYLEGRLLNGKK